MINIQTIVDNAIESNTEAYIEAYNQYDYWLTVEIHGVIDERECLKWRAVYAHKIDTIEETILNMFGKGHAEYIEGKFTNIRFNRK